MDEQNQEGFVSEEKEPVNIIAELREHPDLTRELLYRHLGKADTVALYHDAFERFTRNGKIEYSFTFSFYAFFFTFWFYFYRKLYMPAIAFIAGNIGLSIITSILFAVATHVSYDLYYYHDIPEAVPFIFVFAVNMLLVMALALVCGAYAKYSYIKKFVSDLKIAGFGTDAPADTVIKNVRYLGGYNTWAIIVPIVLAVLSLLLFAASIVLIIIASRIRW